MKLLSLIVFTLSSFLNVYAENNPAENQEDQVRRFSCVELYALAKKNADQKQETFNQKIFHTHRLYIDAGAIASIPLSVAFGPVGALPILGTMAGVGITHAIKNRDTKEEKALDITDETTKRFRRFVEKVQKKISAEITDESVIELVNQGFDSGRYCSNFPKLAGRQEIQDDVEEILRERYVPSEK